MSRDYGELEREFIAGLEERTGKGLAQWVAAIEAAALPGRNEIIDWLRPQGFTFAHASWLERIHHNGGIPVYGQAEVQQPRRPLPVSQPRPGAPRESPPVAVDVGSEPVPSMVPVKAQPPPVPRRQARPFSGDIEALLERGKAFRPLARMLIDAISGWLPESEFKARGEHVVVCNPHPCAYLLVTGKGLRLGLALADVSPPAHAVVGRPVGADLAITHIIMLNDARQIGDDLGRLILASSQAIASR